MGNTESLPIPSLNSESTTRENQNLNPELLSSPIIQILEYAIEQAVSEIPEMTRLRDELSPSLGDDQVRVIINEYLEIMDAIIAQYRDEDNIRKAQVGRALLNALLYLQSGRMEDYEESLFDAIEAANQNFDEVTKEKIRSLIV